MEIDASILSSLTDVPGLSVVVLFGSRAQGTARPDSDLDIAVLPGESHPWPRHKLQARIARSLAELAPAGRVDVVFLDEAPELLRQRILEHGRVLIVTEPDRWKDLKVRTLREHGDREPYRRILREGQMRRLSKDEAGRG